MGGFFFTLRGLDILPVPLAKDQCYYESQVKFKGGIIVKKLNWLAYRVLMLLLIFSLTGCTVARMVEISSGIGVEKTVIDTETRNTSKLTRKDVKLVFTPIRDGLGFRLQYQPHYATESRSVLKYRHSGTRTLSSIGILLELCSILVPPFIGVSRMPDGYEGSALDFVEPREWLLVGIAYADALSALLVGATFEPTKRTGWERSDTWPGTLEGISNRPVSISLPQFGYKDTYHTDYNGSFTIPTNDLIDIINEVSKISDLNPALKTKTIKIDASAKYEEKKAEESFTIYERLNSPLFQALYKRAEKLRSEY